MEKNTALCSCAFCFFPVLTRHYSGLIGASVCGLGIGRVFVSLENEERPRPSLSGESRLAWGEQWNGLPGNAGKGFISGEDHSVSFPATSYPLPTTLALRGFPNQGSPRSMKASRPCAPGVVGGPGGLCSREGRVRMTGNLSLSTALHYTPDPPAHRHPHQAHRSCRPRHRRPCPHTAFLSSPPSYRHVVMSVTL